MERSRGHSDWGVLFLLVSFPWLVPYDKPWDLPLFRIKHYLKYHYSSFWVHCLNWLFDCIPLKLADAAGRNNGYCFIFRLSARSWNTHRDLSCWKGSDQQLPLLTCSGGKWQCCQILGLLRLKKWRIRGHRAMFLLSSTEEEAGGCLFMISVMQELEDTKRSYQGTSSRQAKRGAGSHNIIKLWWSLLRRLWVGKACVGS